MRIGLLTVVGLALVVMTQARLDAHLADREDPRELLFIPDPALLRLMSLGEDNVAADVMWLRCVFYMASFHKEHNHAGHGHSSDEPIRDWLGGGNENERERENENVGVKKDDKKGISFAEEDFNANLRLREILQIGAEKEYAPQLLKILTVVTTLDPNFAVPYYTGAMNLGVLGGRYDEAWELINRGVAARPDRWEMLYYRGFFRLFYFNDKIGAADDILAAARKRGAPVIVVQMAAAFQVGLGRVDAAIEFLQSLKELSNDTVMQEKIDNMLAVYSRHRDKEPIPDKGDANTALERTMIILNNIPNN